MKLLVVDDHSLIREAMRDVLLGMRSGAPALHRMFGAGLPLAARAQPPPDMLRIVCGYPPGGSVLHRQRQGWAPWSASRSLASDRSLVS